MVTIISFILILGLLIFVHELGHFMTARRNGVKADEFGFGFPPRIFGLIWDEATKKFRTVRGNKEIESPHTVYSINWIPLGGFVKIKGENGGDQNEKDSFSSKGAWVRTKILAAGVIMNFILAWALISLVFMVGAPESIECNDPDIDQANIYISEVVPESPASAMGLMIGDEILKDQGAARFRTYCEVREYISSRKGKEIILKVKRGDEILEFRGTPRVDAPETQGPLGIGLAQTKIVARPWYAAIVNGFTTVIDIIIAMLVALGSIIKSVFIGKGAQVEVAGPIGIAVLTKQVTTLGFVYVLQFIAFLSINLGIINALPIPALDGGRILFVLIEKLKGSPVSRKAEQIIHTVGFVLLILLMVFITIKDVVKFVK